MKTKTHMKRITGILMALVLVFAMSGTAFASDLKSYSSSTDTSFTITVDPAYSGETYTAYKIFDVTYSDEDSSGNISYSYTIEGDSVWYSTVSSSGLFTLTQISGSNTYVVVVNDGVTSEQIADAFTSVPDGAVAAATATAGIVRDEDTGESGKTTVTLDVTDSGPGYYFVTTSLGSVVSLDTTNPAVTIEDKNPVPTLTKEVENESHNGRVEDNNDETEGDEDTAKVGDILEFEIKISNAAHKSALCLHDYTTEGLSYYGSEHISIYLNSVSASNKVSSDWYTIQDSNCEDGCDFEIVFNAEWLDDLSDTDVIIITYEAVVNEEAVYVNDNDAFLTYGTNGYSIVVETETDVYGLGLKKVDGDGNELDDATFTLTYSDGTTLVEFVTSQDPDNEGNVIYTVYDAIDDPEHEEETTTNIIVGSATIFGLDVGTYTLTETEAPDGYNKLTSSITVTIAEDGTVTISGNTQGSLTDGTITVVNNAGAILPGTGGMGTTIFYVIGGILVIGAVVLLITRRRMNRQA